MGKNIRSSSSPKALATSFPMPPLADAMDAVRLSVDRFCLLAGVEALAEMMEEDATTVCGARHRRHGNRRGYRWGHTQSEIGYHGGRVKVQRPRVRDHAGGMSRLLLKFVQQALLVEQATQPWPSVQGRG